MAMPVRNIWSDKGGSRWRLPAAAFFASVLLTVPAAVADSPDTAHLVKTELLVEPAAIKPGKPFFAGIRLRMKEHWHTYWRNPGDSGEPTQVTWRLPPGFTAGELQWPAPSPINVGPVTSFGYEDEVMLLARITPPADLQPGAAFKLEADVAYLVCEKICIPGEAKVSFPIATAAPGSNGGPGFADLFERARATLPQPLPFAARFAADAKTITLSLGAEQFGGGTIRSARFFPHDNDLIVNSATQTLDTSSGAKLSIERSQLARVMPAAIDGVLSLEEDVGGKTVQHAFALSAAPDAVFGGVTFLQAVLLALVAGVILNLMPCVFPVLSIKIMHLTQHVGEPPARLRLHGIAYTFGVAASFAILAGALFAARAAGAEVGWGFQLQSPFVVALLAFILFALGLSLSGILPIGASLTRVGGKSLMHKQDLSGSFFGGALATVVATPCTAPFMGASVGFALTQPAAVGLAVFMALAFGLALPFLLLSFVPGLQRLLPKPGRWMETLKQFLAFPLYATVAWLIWVLNFQIGPTGLLAAMSGLVAIAFAAWSYRSSQESSRITSSVLRGMAAASASSVILLAIMVDRDRAAATTAAVAAAEDGYEPFSQQKLDRLLADNRPVFVNMTAAWCITCLVNERAALSTQAVRAALEGKKVAYLKGDWTNRNPEITRLLERFGRSGVPLYVLYRPDREPVILPQILTESLVLDQVGRL
jgi:thiol:disulfide interchange protein DsbD